MDFKVFYMITPEIPGRDVEKHAPEEGVRIDVDAAKKGPAEEVLESESLFHSDYAKRRPYIAEDPDKKAAWRFLPLVSRTGPSRAEYRMLKTEEQRQAYLKKNDAYIRASYEADKRFHERLPATMKVPRLRPSLIERPELMVETPVYVLGGGVSRGIAENFRGGKADYVPGDDPASVLRNFEKQVIKNVSPEKLAGSSVVLTFDRELFASQTPLEKCVEDTKKLLDRLNGLGMKITALSPLKTWQGLKGKETGQLLDPEQNRIRNKRNGFWEALSKFKEDGLITSLVDLGDATQARNTLGTNEAFLETAEGGKQVLNGQGIQMAVNGAIMGINAAHGYGGGSFDNDRYWPGGEDYDLGRNTYKSEMAGGSPEPVKAIPAGAPLVDKKLIDAAREKVQPKDPLDTLRRLDTDLMGPELLTMTHDELYERYMDKRFIPGMHVSSHPARKAVDEAFQAVRKAKDAGEDVTEMTREFSRLASSVYIKLARIAIIHAREVFEDKESFSFRRSAYEHAKKKVKDAEAANGFQHLFDGRVADLKKEWEDFEEKWKTV